MVATLSVFPGLEDQATFEELHEKLASLDRIPVYEILPISEPIGEHRPELGPVEGDDAPWTTSARAFVFA